MERALQTLMTYRNLSCVEDRLQRDNTGGEETHENVTAMSRTWAAEGVTQGKKV